MSEATDPITKAIGLCSVALCDELISVLQNKVKRRKKRSIWTRNWILRRTALGASNNIFRELYVEDPREYKSVTRLTPKQFDYLLNLISPIIETKDTFMREAIPARVKLEITLTFLASGTSFRMLSVFFRVSKSSISKIIPKVCDAISIVLKEHIKIPNKTEWEGIQVGFSEKWNFPGCCGAIDGKHVQIQAPPNCGSEHFNYKGTNSIILLAVVDHDYCFRYVDIGSYGRNADGGVFQRSTLFPVLEDGSLLPEGGLLVADDAFPLKEYLLKPYSPPSTYEEKIFNYRLSRARRIVENGFGILASRFRIFGKPIQLKLETILKILKTTCTLHNWLRTTSPSTYTPPESVDYEDILNGMVVQGKWRSEITALESLHCSRMNNRSTAISTKLRNKYKDYFSGEGQVYWQNNMIR